MNMSFLRLQALHMHPGQIPDRIQHVLPALAGQSQDHMNDDLRTDPLQVPDRLLKDGEGIAPVDRCRRPFVDGLQTQLHPDRLHLIQVPQHVQDLRRQTVRPRPQGQGHNLRPPHRLHIQVSQPFQLVMVPRVCI